MLSGSFTGSYINADIFLFYTYQHTLDIDLHISSLHHLIKSDSTNKNGSEKINLVLINSQSQ